MKTLDFVVKHTADKTLIRLVDWDTGKLLYEGRTEFLRNDYGEEYPDAYNSNLGWLDNTTDDVVLIFVEVVNNVV